MTEKAKRTIISNSFDTQFSDSHVKPLGYATGYIEPYYDRDQEILNQFSKAKIKEPFIRTEKHHEPQDLNFEED